MGGKGGVKKRMRGLRAYLKSQGVDAAGIAAIMKKFMDGGGRLKNLSGGISFTNAQGKTVRKNIGSVLTSFTKANRVKGGKNSVKTRWKNAKMNRAGTVKAAGKRMQVSPRKRSYAKVKRTKGGA